ncbi:MAG: Hpt domain-containing protein [Pseudomonadota bacterium]
MSIPVCNSQTYGWIKSALNESLNRVIQSVELASSNDDFSGISQTTSDLHQVQGSLKMVELDAASAFAADIELLCKKVASADSSVQIASVPVIQSALLALKKYLQAIENETPVSPLQLKGDVNAVRELIPSPLLDSYDLFDPPMQISADIPHEGAPIPEEVREKQLVNLRRQFRRTLLKWLSGDDAKHQLKQMSKMLDGLKKLSTLDVSHQLWWIAGGFVDSVYESDLEGDINIKAQFARLDSEILRMKDESSATIVADPPDELVRRMLYYIGTTNVDSEKINEIKEVTGLRSWFDESSRHVELDRFAPLREKARAYAIDLDEQQLQHIEEYLDKYFAGELDRQGVTRLLASLNQLAISSENAELELIAELIICIRDTVRIIESDRSILQESTADIKVASSMLLVQDIMNDPDRIDEDWYQSTEARLSELRAIIDRDSDDPGGAQLARAQSEAEYIQARELVRENLIGSLTALETAFTAMQRKQISAELIKPIPAKLHEVGGSFSILGYDGFAQLSREAETLFGRLASGETNLISGDHERVAYVIASLGVAADQLGRFSNESRELLENAREALKTIGSSDDLDESLLSLDPLNDPDLEMIDADQLVDWDLDDDDELPDADLFDESEDVSGGSSDWIDDLTLRGYAEEASGLFSRIQQGHRDNIDYLTLSAKLEQIRVRAGELNNTALADTARSGLALSSELPFDYEENGESLGSLVRDVCALIEVRAITVEPSAETEAVSDLNSKNEEASESENSEIESEDLLSSSESIDLASFPRRIVGDDELRAIFLGELQGHISRLEEDIDGPLTDGESRLPDSTALTLHTLSGNCRNVLLGELADYADSVEKLVEKKPVPDVIRPVLTTAVEQLKLCFQQLESDGEYDLATATRLQKMASEIAADAESLESESLLDALSPPGQTILKVSEEGPDAETDSQASISEVTETSADDDEIDDEIREIFFSEAETVLENINSSLSAWRESGLSDELVASVRRDFHTLKGSAATTGFDSISELSHSVESLLDDRIRSSDFDDQALLNLLEEMHDGLAADLGFIPDTKASHIESLQKMVASLLDTGDEIAGASDSPESDDPEIQSDQDGDIELSSSVEDIDEDAQTQGTTEMLAGIGQGKLVPESFRSIDDLEEDSDHDADDEAAPATNDVESENDFSPREVDPDDDQNSDGDAESDWPESDAESLIDATVDDETTEDEFDRFWTPPSSIALQARAEEQDAQASGFLRIGNQKLAELINTSGELGLVRSQLKDTLDNTRLNLELLRNSMTSMRDDLRSLELQADEQIRSLPERELTDGEEDFDPLQLDRYSQLQAKSREISSRLDALAEVERNLGDRAAELSSALLQQTYLGDQLQDGLMSARMVAISDYLPRLRHICRETARTQNKPANFSLIGGDIEVDRQVMDSMMAPFEHMIRNAVIHGVEDTESRKRSDKSATATLQLDVVQQGTELILEFSDDGGGLDENKLGERAAEMGLVQNVGDATREDYLEVIAQRGFSTSEDISLGAGRGVGMDVVVQTVKDLGGSMALLSTDEKGVVFQFRLPVTLAVTQALLVNVGVTRYAIRSRTIERVIRAPSNAVQEENGLRVFREGERVWPVIDLAQKLGENSQKPDENIASLVLVRLADRVCAFEVDSFGGSQDIVNKRPGSQLTSIPGISGVTVLADSSLILILDPDGLVERDQLLVAASSDVRQELSDDQTENETPIDDTLSIVSETIDSTFPNVDSPSDHSAVNVEISRVLAVDDSLVVRRVMQRDLQGLGIDLISAIDGQDAWDQLQNETVDLALVDIEMPRMNGYELLSKIRSSDLHQSLPVIMITSRSGDQHRQRALDLGADEYVTKPYNLDSLHDLMRMVVANRRRLH